MDRLADFISTKPNVIYESWISVKALYLPYKIKLK